MSSVLDFDLTQASSNVLALRQDFEALNTKVHGTNLIYLDSAATSLKPKSVSEAISCYYLKETANVHRGIHYLSEKATTAFEGVRQKVQKFIGAQFSEEIIFTSGTTDSINLVAQSLAQGFLKPGDEILITEMEHHSNIVPWQMICQKGGFNLKVIPVNAVGDLDLSTLDSLLTSKVKLLSATYISNTLGTINPIPALIAKAHAVKALVLVDAAQAMMHTEIDVQKLDCDFLVFSGHKMLGPTGIGVLYGQKKWLEIMPPVKGGGAMIASVSFEGTTYNDLPYKFEAGTPAIASVLGLGAALDYLQKVGLNWIQAYEHALLVLAKKELSKIEGLEFLGSPKEQSAIISFTIKGVHPHDLATLIDHEGVAIRTGHHCTQPLLKKFGLTAVSRASFSFYNTPEEILLFVAALKKIKGLLV